MAISRKLGMFTVGCALAGALYADQDMQKQVSKKSSVKTLNVAYVDSLAAMRDSKAGQIATAELESRRKRMADDLQKNEKQFAQDVKEAQEKASMMSEEAREKEHKRLAKRERELKAKAQEYEDELRSEMQRVTEKLSKELDDAVYEYARASNLDVVVDRVTGRVIYSAADQEPTEKVVTIMDKNHENKILAESKKPAGTSVAKVDKKANPAA